MLIKLARIVDFLNLINLENHIFEDVDGFNYNNDFDYNNVNKKLSLIKEEDIKEKLSFLYKKGVNIFCKIRN